MGKLVGWVNQRYVVNRIITGQLYFYKGYLFGSAPIDTVISSSNGIRDYSPVFLLTTSPYVTGGVTTACCSKR